MTDTYIFYIKHSSQLGVFVDLNKQSNTAEALNKDQTMKVIINS